MTESVERDNRKRIDLTIWGLIVSANGFLENLVRRGDVHLFSVILSKYIVFSLPVGANGETIFLLLNFMLEKNPKSLFGYCDCPETCKGLWRFNDGSFFRPGCCLTDSYSVFFEVDIIPRKRNQLPATEASIESDCQNREFFKYGLSLGMALMREASDTLKIRSDEYGDANILEENQNPPNAVEAESN